MTREADHWLRHGDRSFTSFTDIISSRFIQLYYRSWSDGRGITQFDYRTGGNFPKHLQSLVGELSLQEGAINEFARLRYVGQSCGRVRSPVRLREILEMHFKTKVNVEEFVTSWLVLPEEELTQLSQNCSRLGADAKVGSRIPSTEEKVIIHLECKNLEDYASCLPGRKKYKELVDLALGYAGQFITIEVKLFLAKCWLVQPRLGETAELGWMSVFTGNASTSESEDILHKQFDVPVRVTETNETNPIEQKNYKLWQSITLNSETAAEEKPVFVHLAVDEKDWIQGWGVDGHIKQKLLSKLTSLFGKLRAIFVRVWILEEHIETTLSISLQRLTYGVELSKFPIEIEDKSEGIDGDLVQMCRYQLEPI